MRFRIYAKNPNLLPKKHHDTDAGLDLRSNETMCIEPGQTYLVKTGVYLEIAPGFVGLLFARSGLSSKFGLCLANAVGVIDADYRGEIMCAMKNTGPIAYTVRKYDRIAQLVTVPILTSGYEVVDSLEELSTTERGSGGFGSTG